MHATSSHAAMQNPRPTSANAATTSPEMLLLSSHALGAENVFDWQSSTRAVKCQCEKVHECWAGAGHTGVLWHAAPHACLTVCELKQLSARAHAHAIAWPDVSSACCCRVVPPIMPCGLEFCSRYCGQFVLHHCVGWLACKFVV